MQAAALHDGVRGVLGAEPARGPRLPAAAVARAEPRTRPAAQPQKADEGQEPHALHVTSEMSARAEEYAFIIHSGL
jgi:hypothetical protein